MSTAFLSLRNNIWYLAFALALSSTVYYHFFQQPLGITEGYMFISNLLETEPQIAKNPKNWLLSGIVLGAFLAAATKGQAFSWLNFSKPKSSQVLTSLLGGFLMGYGAKIANGCLLTSVFTGIPMGSFQGWLFLLSLFPGVLVGLSIIKFIRRKTLASTTKHN